MSEIAEVEEKPPLEDADEEDDEEDDEEEEVWPELRKTFPEYLAVRLDAVKALDSKFESIEEEFMAERIKLENLFYLGKLPCLLSEKISSLVCHTLTLQRLSRAEFQSFGSSVCSTIQNSWN